MLRKFDLPMALMLGSASLVLAVPAFAQGDPASEQASGDAVSPASTDEKDASFFADTIVTETKLSGGQRTQSAPVAISAFGSDQSDALIGTDLQAFQAVIPDAQFGMSGFSKSVNFGLRGLDLSGGLCRCFARKGRAIGAEISY